MSDEPITLRAARPSDHDFLVALYASTRADEFAHLGWPVETERAFLETQFDAQRLDYERRHPGAECDIVEQRRCPIGRVWVAQDARSLVLLDITIVAELRGQGIGTDCLRRLLRRADLASLEIELQVVAGNRARRLYERLGFRPVGPAGVRQAMVRRPVPANTSQETHHEQA